MPLKKTESVTLRVASNVFASIVSIAKATGHQTTEIIVRALRTYLLDEAADVLSAIRGREQIAAGELEDIDDLIVDVDNIIASCSP